MSSENGFNFTDSIDLNKTITDYEDSLNKAIMGDSDSPINNREFRHNSQFNGNLKKELLPEFVREHTIQGNCKEDKEEDSNSYLGVQDRLFGDLKEESYRAGSFRGDNALKYQDEDINLNSQGTCNFNNESKTPQVAPSERTPIDRQNNIAKCGRLDPKPFYANFREERMRCMLHEDSINFSMSKRSDSKSQSLNANHNQGRWSSEEHTKFLQAMYLYGNEWKRVQEYIGTRSSTQARSHAQKFFIRLKKQFAYDQNNKEETIEKKTEKIMNWIKEFITPEVIEKGKEESKDFKNHSKKLCEVIINLISMEFLPDQYKVSQNSNYVNSVNGNEFHWQNESEANVPFINEVDNNSSLIYSRPILNSNTHMIETFAHSEEFKKIKIPFAHSDADEIRFLSSKRRLNSETVSKYKFIQKKKKINKNITEKQNKTGMPNNHLHAISKSSDCKRGDSPIFKIVKENRKKELIQQSIPYLVKPNKMFEDDGLMKGCQNSDQTSNPSALTPNSLFANQNLNHFISIVNINIESKNNSGNVVNNVINNNNNCVNINNSLGNTNNSNCDPSNEENLNQNMSLANIPNLALFSNFNAFNSTNPNNCINKIPFAIPEQNKEAYLQLIKNRMIQILLQNQNAQNEKNSLINNLTLNKSLSLNNIQQINSPCSNLNSAIQQSYSQPNISEDRMNFGNSVFNINFDCDTEFGLGGNLDFTHDKELDMMRINPLDQNEFSNSAIKDEDPINHFDLNEFFNFD